jgi:hypothetical protein
VDETSPNSAWGLAARLMADRHGHDFYHALDRVIVHFLQHGDTRPLLELLNDGGAPGLGTALYVGGMLDQRLRAAIPADIAPRFEIRIVDNRGRGKPRAEASERAKQRHGHIEVGLRLLRNGRPAHRLFWITLKKALEPEPDFPLRADIVRIDGGTGRPADPELPIRDLFLAMLMKAKRGKEKYEYADDEVLAGIMKDAEAEGWTGRLDAQTIRKAYERCGQFSAKSK